MSSLYWRLLPSVSSYSIIFRSYVFPQYEGSMSSCWFPSPRVGFFMGVPDSFVAAEDWRQIDSFKRFRRVNILKPMNHMEVDHNHEQWESALPFVETS